ncbi:MAG TPA: hypothetical protein VK920_07310 [Solirubrobacterales bacterium]|nr:hypothetical protein [Solirubrobacterales bacterium]
MAVAATLLALGVMLGGTRSGAVVLARAERARYEPDAPGVAAARQ